MEVRHATAPDEVPRLDTAGLRARFLVDDLFAGPGVRFTYSHHDRLVVGGVVVGDTPVDLPAPAPLRASHFLERREMGVVNVGAGAATVEVDGVSFPLAARECLYVGRGARVVRFLAGRLYLVSTAAHADFPTRSATLADATPVNLGSVSGSNERTIYKYIHADGSMWNTMPCHTHDRRTEVYCYFDLPPEHRVVHLMGEPHETRNLVVADGQAVISPPWSVHCGFGTHSYSFVWAMGGENQAYDDLEPVDIRDLR